jgi:hypothetical protein
VSDQQLARLFFTTSTLHEYGAVSITRLSKSLAIKGGRGVAPSESQNMAFAAESLHLPIPPAHRTFTADITGIANGQLVKGYFIVLDWLPGPTVEECGDSLELDQRLWVVVRLPP